MKRHLPVFTSLIALVAGTATASGQIITITPGTAAYTGSPVVITPEAAVTSASHQIFLRDPRATLQTFQVGSELELTALNVIIRRALEGATFTLTLRDFGTTAPANSLTPAAVTGATSLASINHTVTAAQAFGAAGPISAADPFNTMTWGMAAPVTLVPGNFYGLVFDGTNVTTGAPHIIHSYALGNPYAGGLGYYQDGNANNFRTDVFGSGNNQQADFSLALVPEPSTYAALLGLAALGLVMWRRRSLR